MTAPARPILVYLPFPGFWGNKVTVTTSVSEGYPTGELSIEHLTWDHLLALADFMVGLPPELYAAVEQPHAIIEGVLARAGKV